MALQCPEALRAEPWAQVTSERALTTSGIFLYHFLITTYLQQYIGEPFLDLGVKSLPKNDLMKQSIVR